MIQLPRSTSIVAIRQENYRTKTFSLDLKLAGDPGQFIMAWLPRFDEKPFSLVSADPVTIMVTAVGPFSRLLHEQRVGDRLWLRGAMGQGFHVPETERRLALIGGGYGVAPLYWLAQSQVGKATAIEVIIGARTAQDLLYVDHFQALATTARNVGTQLTLHLTTEDSSQGVGGRVTDALLPLVTAGQVDGIYACGPHPMLAALERVASQYALPTQLSWEAYMRCGIGICGACEHEGKVLCLDGPVLAKAGKQQ